MCFQLSKDRTVALLFCQHSVSLLCQVVRSDKVITSAKLQLFRQKQPSYKQARHFMHYAFSPVYAKHENKKGIPAHRADVHLSSQYYICSVSNRSVLISLATAALFEPCFRHVIACHFLIANPGVNNQLFRRYSLLHKPFSNTGIFPLPLIFISILPTIQESQSLRHRKNFQSRHDWARLATFFPVCYSCQRSCQINNILRMISHFEAAIFHILLSE